MVEKASRTGATISELEGQLSHFFVLLLGELVLEGGQELGIDLKDEAFDVIGNQLELCLCVIGGLLHLTIPHVNLLDALCGKNEGCGRKLTSVVLQE